jgi:hypothetical protein
LVAAVVACVDAVAALAAASLAFVEAITAWAVTSPRVASLVESPAPPSPLNIAIVAPKKTTEYNKKNKERGLRRIPVSVVLALNS